MNTSITFSKLQLQTRGDTNIVDDTLSNVEVLGCLILCNDEKTNGLFRIVHGRALFNNMSLNAKSQNNQIPQLVASEQSAKKRWIGDDFEAVMLSSSTFSDLVFEKAPIIESSHSSSLSIDKCVFSNISSTQKKDPFCSEISSLQKGNGAFIISGCELHDVENVFYGGIGDSNHALNVFNTSVMHCARTMNSSSRVELNDDRSFEYTEFVDQHVTDYSSIDIGFHTCGGAILFNGPSSSLKVMSCIFTNCSCSRWGGGICVVDSSTTRIGNCTFDHCIGKRNNRNAGSHGGAIFHGQSQCFDITHSIAKNGHTTGYGGAVLLALGSPSISTECNFNTLENGSPILLFNITYENETLDSTYGSALLVEINPPTFFIMSECVFQNCSAKNSNGGGIWINVSPLEMNTKFCFYCFFFNNSASQASDVYLNDLDEKIKESPFVECYSLTSGESRCVSSSQGTKNEWLPNGFLVRYVIPDGGNNNALCGLTVEDGCSSLKFTLEDTLTKSRCRIMLIEGIYETAESNGYVVFGKRISIQGRGKDLTQLNPVQVEADQVFLSVDDGICKLSSLNIVFDSHESSRLFRLSSSNSQLFLQKLVISTPLNQEGLPSKEYLNSLFEVNFANFRMTDCIVENVLSKASLFQETSSASLLVSSSSSSLPNSDESFVANSNFSHVTKTEGDGAVLSKTISEGESFCLWNTTIENCECSSGSGGGIRIEMTSSTSTFRMGSSSLPTTLDSCSCSKCGGGLYLWLEDGTTDFVISSVSFVNCEAGEGGRNLFVNGSNMNGETINLEKIRISLNGLGFEELMGFDRSLNEIGLFPLNVFWEPFQPPAHVGGAEVNWVFDSCFCGFSFFPCLTIMHAAQLRYGSSQRKIVVGEGYELDEEMMMDEPVWNISCEQKGMAVDVHAPQAEISNQWLVSVSTECSIYNICFSLPSSLSNAHSFITLPTSTSSLTLSNCSSMNSASESGSEIGFCFASVVGGELKMEMFETKGAMVFSSHSLIEGKGSSFVVNCVESVFEGITKENGDGACICVCVEDESSAHESEKKQLIIDNCTLNGCWAKGSRAKGGGLHVCLRGNDEMVVNGSSKFDGCCAGKREEGEEDGCGGGVFVQVGDAECLLSIEQGVQFSNEKANIARDGKDVFVWCGNGVQLEFLINTSSFGFFDHSILPSDGTRLNGCENGEDDPVIPLHVYLCSMPSPVMVDGREGVDHTKCGFSLFCCRSIDFCANKRVSQAINEIEVASSSSINTQISVSLFPLLLSSSSSSSKESEITVNVSDTGEATQDGLIRCSNSLSISGLSFVLPRAFQQSRKAFLQSSSALSLSICSISFAEEPDSEGITISVILVERGDLTLNEFSMNSEVEFSASSPISITNGGNITIKKSEILGIKHSGGDGGWLSVTGMDEGARWITVDNCTVNSSCVQGNNLKGGGMLIELAKECELKCNNTEMTGCGVPEEETETEREREREVGGRGLGGGVFLSLEDEATQFVLLDMKFVGCCAWKGKNVFVNGSSLDEVVDSTHFCWEMSEKEKSSMDEMCGWERGSAGVGFVIPLVVYLWSNFSGSGFVDGEEGGDFSGCGYAAAPCRSISHLISLKFTPLPGSSSSSDDDDGLSISVSHISSLTSSLFLSSSVESEQISMKFIGKDNEPGIGVGDDPVGNEEWTIHSTIHLSFEVLSFHIPTAFAHHRTFIRSSTSSSLLQMKHCSFTPQSSSEPVSFTLLSVSEGSLLIDNCSLSSFSTTYPFLLVSLPSQSITLSNMTVSNVSISSCSLVTFERTPSHLPVNSSAHNEVSDKPCCSLQILSSSFANITCSGDSATILCLGVFDAVESVVEKCTFSRCVSEASERGGALMMCVKSEESLVEVRQCSFTLCKCSTVVGRGGGMMFDCVDPSLPAPAQDGSLFLPLKISEIRFTMNDALVGKDIFINCQSIEQQINETLFALDFTQESLQSNKSICASDADEQDVDLIPLITFLYAPQIFVCLDSADTRQCGLPTNPCQSISSAVHHIQQGLLNTIFINTSSTFLSETTVHGLSILPSTKQQATIQLSITIPHTGDAPSVVLFEEDCTVRNCLISFASSFESTHSAVFAESCGSLEVSQCTFTAADALLELDSLVMAVWGGVLKMSETSFSWLSFAKPLLLFSDESEIVFSQLTLDSLALTADVVAIGQSATVSIEKMNCSNISLNKGCLISTNKEELNMNGNGRNNDEGNGSLRISISSFVNISSNENNNNNESVVRIESDKSNVNLINCSFSYCLLSTEKGSQLSVSESSNVIVVSCLFDGKATDEPISHQKNNDMGEDEEENDKEHNPLCGWNGSVVDVKSSNVTMKDTTISTSKKGGLSLFGGSVEIEKGEFTNNNPSIQNYPSARRNILCEGSSELSVVSLKGGDGTLPNISLWILDGGCSLEGIAGERASPFFIPKVESVSSEKSGEKVNLVFRGSLLLPCNLSFETVAAEGDEEVVEKHLFDERGFISEEEVHGSVPVETIEGVASGAEVRVCILFGNPSSPSSTESFILKNKSTSESKGDERIVEGGKDGKLSWILIVCIAIVVALLIVSIVFIVRWRKQKRRTRELEEIVNDTVRKDPKVFEMVTMEMSPEEQWRRAEREAEKKNEERIKKRVYENSLGHSESSEHLLSESGSTEYILGRDSDKIPEWALEKVDEKEVEEETRKRSPSPSISSTSTTDSDSTFVRGEDLCPTTSSMSNLVDAIACSSVFEKLIVDLRDSLFMLLHGRNEKKEMAIGTLKEREHTAAQVLFWVANGALHSFENEEDELSSLANLSPHIVLFSEHMIICIAKHSDFSSDDSDSSSISSASTIITSSSDFSSANRNGRGSPPPSSAFEDEDDNRKECLRWKAPELQMNKKMGATEKSVVFSIGMMLWECLTLQIPFGEYGAVVAGQKIVNGERPDMKGVSGNTFEAVVKSCVSERGCERVELNVLKREFIQRFPPGTVMVTMSDAIGYNELSEEEELSVSAEARKLIESMNK
ncbi:uncharacterized protein MONOS_743 [Monocercomonoides exilis]|uniref:uncharacterized protein n=1 Tax=Monocercomonoides exilis TaxID=2049356 RepID=UPI003559E8DF|nr:hypothetical protein MONOS_743 [Monocercomonoides exilis]|eukprot:MONOS_743.1-p1 / transcript=MONOS_743.1 / gene=MONOS_743 / organism=Monocercomonoides_exilis_PA203 / gene_product=unspecified product / transcript_product=unspecified product / location=Mono_scaffold00012:191775-200807(-) / protein_length=2985 / sequence_SO=supercontig / SO=protein_coding / is_pseudo=false